MKHNGINYKKEDYTTSYEAALAHISEKLIKGVYKDVTVGSDVEVLWLNAFKSLDGSQKFIFYNADNIFVKNGIFGTDGRSLQGEWRFTPASDLNIFMEFVEKSLALCKEYTINRQKLSINIPNIFPYGMGCYEIFKQHNIDKPESIGLHIHLGMTRKKNILDTLVSAFDLFLNPVIKRFESPTGYYVRTVCGFYGNVSDYEEKQYGYEYKTLPSCIDNKDVFAGTFALAKCLAFAIQNNEICLEDFQDFKLDPDRLIDKDFLKYLTKVSWKFVKNNCSYYWIEKERIDKLYELALLKDPTKLFSTYEDIFSYWGIQGYEPKTEEEKLKLQDVFNSYAFAIPLETPIVGYKKGSPLHRVKKPSGNIEKFYKVVS